MFAIEIAFSDGVSQAEAILVRRPQALIGSSDYAHVVIDDMRDLNYQIRLIRDLGRRFRTKPVTTTNDQVQIPAGIEGVYDGSVTLNLGKVRLVINSLDTDLHYKENEPPDRAGVRIMRQACSSPSPYFPAVVVRGGVPMIVSFSPDFPVFIGRSKQCVVRLDSADISARHARLGYEGRQFWIEDLGSTNGTFVHEQQISGRVNVAPGVPIVLGREATLIGVTSEEEVITAARGPVEEPTTQNQIEKRYPILLSTSETVRPARVVLMPGTTVSIGRDPASDMWVGAPHISRKHCSVSLDERGALTITDSSTNGTAYDGGVLKNGESLTVGPELQTVDLGGGVTIAICCNEEQENAFMSMYNNPLAAFKESGNFLSTTPSITLPEGETSVEQSLSLFQRVTMVLEDLRAMFLSSGKSGQLVFLMLILLLVVVVGVIVVLLIPLMFS